MNKIEIWNEDKNEIPLIVSIPHSGTYIPQEMRGNLIDNVVLSNMDWYLPNLYSFLKNLEITTIINNVSRYVIDPNREIINNTSDFFVHKYVYTKTTFNYPMYKKTLDNNEIKFRIQEYYNPYHKEISHLINEKLTNFNKVYLIDLHSFGKDIDEDIVLGNKNGETARKEFTNLVRDSLEKLDFKVNLNNPYSGGYIVRKYANENVETLQIELSYKKYIENKIFGNEEFPRIHKNSFNEIQEKMKSFFEEIVHQILEI